MFTTTSTNLIMETTLASFDKIMSGSLELGTRQFSDENESIITCSNNTQSAESYLHSAP